MRGPKEIYKIGTKFGEWTVINDRPIPKGNGYYHFECQCSCGCIKRNQPSHNYKGLENLSQKYFNRLKTGAIKRNYEFNLTKQYLISIFDGKCELSGINITLNRNTEKQTASVDRINSSKGYIEGNVQWVHKKINWLKRNMNDIEFINWCKLITKHNENN